MAYASSFLSIVAAFVHVWLWHGQDIYRRFQAALHQIEDKDDNGDIHNVLMRAYPDVSESFFLGFLFVLVLFQISISFTTPFHMPVWAILLCLFMSLLSVLPIGIITAVSGQRLGLNVLTEFVIGLLMPGETIPVMAFKSLGTNSVSQAIMLLQDLKLGHYMKINPRHMIAAQLYGSLIGAIINTSCCFWVLDNMKSLLGTGDWQATSFFVFYNAGAIWGAIGPKRFFGIGSVYESLLYAFALGLILPFIPYLLNKTYPHTLWKYVHVPLLSSFDGPGRYQNRVIIPLLVAWYFQYYRARYHPIWWQKYNYVLAVRTTYPGSFGCWRWSLCIVGRDIW